MEQSFPSRGEAANAHSRPPLSDFRFSSTDRFYGFGGGVEDESGGVAGAGAMLLSAGGVDASGAAAGGAIVESAGGAACGSVEFCLEQAAVKASTPRQRKTALRFMETSEVSVRVTNVLSLKV